MEISFFVKICVLTWHFDLKSDKAALKAKQHSCFLCKTFPSIFFNIAANLRAIFLKLRYNRCHQLQAATLQMIINTPETE